MSENQFLQALINLIEFDQTIVKKETLVAHLEQNITHKEVARTQLIDRHKLAEEKMHGAQKMVHEHELEMKSLDTQEQEKKKLLENTDSQKIYDSLKKEITFLKKSQYDHEKKLVQSWKELETAQRILAEETAQFQAQEQVLTQEINVKKEETSTLNKELQELYVMRTEKEHGVPAEWLTKYSNMRSQTTNPIVRVEFDSCGGCFAQLTAQALLDLKHKKLIQCPSCYRFLYQIDDSELL